MRRGKAPIEAQSWGRPGGGKSSLVWLECKMGNVREAQDGDFRRSQMLDCRHWFLSDEGPAKAYKQVTRWNVMWDWSQWELAWAFSCKQSGGGEKDPIIVLEAWKLGLGEWNVGSLERLCVGHRVGDVRLWKETGLPGGWNGWDTTKEGQSFTCL